jgi:hypothetical protein
MIRYRRSASSVAESGMREGKQEFVYEFEVGSDGTASAGKMTVEGGGGNAEPLGNLFDGDRRIA